MEAKSLTWVLGHNLNLRYPSLRHRFFPAYCKNRPRNLSSQNRKQQGKKFFRSRPTYENIRANSDEESDIESPSKIHAPNLEGSDDEAITSVSAVQSDEKEISSLLNEITSLV